jgi:hypothetical protein
MPPDYVMSTYYIRERKGHIYGYAESLGNRKKSLKQEAAFAAVYQLSVVFFLNRRAD